MNDHKQPAAVNEKGYKTLIDDIAKVIVKKRKVACSNGQNKEVIQIEKHEQFPFGHHIADELVDDNEKEKKP